MNTAVNRVFGCDDLRRNILSYIPKRCKSCHQQMNTKPPHFQATVYTGGYLDYEWRRAECVFMKGYCNWCYYYVFEYR